MGNEGAKSESHRNDLETDTDGIAKNTQHRSPAPQNQSSADCVDDGGAGNDNHHQGN